MQEVSTVPGPAGLTARVGRVFGADGPLARALAGFEPRAGQLEMAGAVARAFEQGGVLLAEAGTGTGKTLAYLIPAILSRQRVLVSTGTKNLQEQIFFKDLPVLRAALDVPFTATCMKGRANYLCLHRLDQIAERPADPGGGVFLPIVREWSVRTETGDRAELEGLPEELPFWSEVAATAETCLGGECPRYDDCFVTRMRQRAAASDVVIVNHHLLCADAAVRQNAYGEVIPGFTHAVIDEAHQLEDVATQYFGYAVSNYRLEDLARDAERCAASMEDRSDRADTVKAVDRLRDAGRAFFGDLSIAHGGDDGTRWPSIRPTTRGRELALEAGGRGRGVVRATDASLRHARDAAADLSGTLDLLEATLALTTASARDDDHRGGSNADGTHNGMSHGGESRPEPESRDAQALARRAGELRDELRLLMRADDPSYVYFVEFRGKGVSLRASPIDVSEILGTVLFDRMRTTVLTSATLTVDGTFEYIRSRLGIAAAGELRLPSEFDFTHQALLYLPRSMPDPRSVDFPLAAAREVIELLKRSKGRAFVLFTSYATLRAVQAVAEMAVAYPILAQGTAPRSQLLAQFRATPHSVLFATSSFWQGVDVAGDALSCVIVDKLPFASPADPVTAARIEAIRERGGEPFEEYQLPLAILALQQGLGRLIRHRRDRGVLAVLDPRLRTKGYGRRFVASLPPAPVVHDLATVERFFNLV